MVLNIQTGYLSSQFHVVYAKKFETVTTDMSINLSETWIDLWENSQDFCLNSWDTDVDGPLPTTGQDFDPDNQEQDPVMTNVPPASWVL